MTTVRFASIDVFRKLSVYLTGTAAAVSLLLASELAAAATCVSIDESRDNLTPADREGARALFEEGLSELSGMYSQIARSIQTGIVGSSESPIVDRKNVTDNQTMPNRLPADSIWYLTLGYGATVASGLYGGPSFGIGKRWELDRVGIDLSFLNVAIFQGQNGTQGAAGAWLKIGAEYFFDAYSNYSCLL